MKALTVSLVVFPLKRLDAVFFFKDIFKMNTGINAKKEGKKKFVSSQDSLASH